MEQSELPNQEQDNGEFKFPHDCHHLGGGPIGEAGRRVFLSGVRAKGITPFDYCGVKEYCTAKEACQRNCLNFR